VNANEVRIFVVRHPDGTITQMVSGRSG
jgi:hypothetical protein